MKKKSPKLGSKEIGTTYDFSTSRNRCGGIRSKWVVAWMVVSVYGYVRLCISMLSKDFAAQEKKREKYAHIRDTWHSTTMSTLNPLEFHLFCIVSLFCCVISSSFFLILFLQGRTQESEARKKGRYVDTEAPNSAGETLPRSVFYFESVSRRLNAILKVPCSNLL